MNTVQGRQIDLTLQTVLLTTNKISPTNLYLFRCYHCGTGITKIQGNVAQILADTVPSLDIPVINQCYKCKENYTFQTKIYLKPAPIRLSLASLGRLSTFHCIICRNQLLQYNENIVYNMPQRLEVTLPYAFDCFNASCSMNYLLNEVVGLSDIIVNEDLPRYN